MYEYARRDVEDAFDIYSDEASALVEEYYDNNSIYW